MFQSVHPNNIKVEKFEAVLNHQNISQRGKIVAREFISLVFGWMIQLILHTDGALFL